MMTMSKKIGRNTPCPCGSGKKYKKCCLLGDWIDGKTVSELLEDAAGWILNEPELDNEFEAVLEEYGNAWVMKESDFDLLLDAFIFDRKLEGGETPFQHFLNQAEITDSHLPVYRGFEDNVFSIFEVLEVYEGVGMKMKDLLWEKEYFVKENKGSYQLEPGYIVFCRLSPFRSRFIIISPGTHAYLPEVGYVIKRKLRHFRQSFREEMNAFTMLEIIFGRGPEEEDVREADLETLKYRLKKKLDSLGIKIDFRGLARRINENITPRDAFPEIFEFNYPSKEDFNETLELLHALWNKHPRKELGGRSPKEVDVKGPRERELLLDLFEECKMRFDPDDYSSEEEFQDAVDRLKDEWLWMPQLELEGKTPRDVILEERKARGNPNEDIAIRLEVSRVQDYEQTRAEELYQEGLKAFKQGAIVKAADLFEEVTDMYPENYKAWGNLAISLAYAGNKERSMECFEKALAIEPEYELARKNRDMIEKHSGKELALLGVAGACQGILHDMDKTKGDDFDVLEDVFSKMKEEKRKKHNPATQRNS